MDIRSVSVTFLARIIAMAGPFGVSIVTARALGPEDRGAYFLIVSYAQIASQIANLGLHSSNTYMVADNKTLAGRLLGNGLSVALVVGPLLALPIAIGLGWPDLIGIGGSGSSLGSPVLFAVMLTPLLVAFLYTTNMAVAVQHIALFNALTIMMGVLTIGAAGLVWASGGALYEFLWAAVIALFVGTVIGMLALARGPDFNLRIDLQLLRQGVGYAVRAWLATLFGFVLMRAGVVVLQWQGELSVVGQFSIAQQIGDALILLPSTVALLLFPDLVRTSDPETRWRNTRKAAVWLGSAMAVICLGIAVVAPWVVPFVFGAEYQPAVDLVNGILVSVFVMSLITVVSQFLSAAGFPWSQVITWIIGCALHVGLSVILVPQYGALGVVFSLAITTSLILITLCCIAWRRRPGGPDQAARSKGVSIQ